MKADIDIQEQTPTAITFQVTVDTQKRNAAYTLWVANKLLQGGKTVSAEYLPVRYEAGGTNPTDGVAGPFTLVPRSELDNTLASDSALAYVWAHPNSETPVKQGDSTVEYKP